MLTVAVDVSFLLPLLWTSVCVNRPTSSEPLMNRSLFWGILRMPDNTVTQSLVPVVCGIRTRSEVWNVAFDEGTPAAWTLFRVSGRTRLNARIPPSNLLVFVFILLSFHLEPAYLGRTVSNRF